MPFKELQRCDSWPPTLVRVRDEDEEIINEIDEDPFSFFLTSPEDIDDFLDEDLSAGIEIADSKSIVREVSPSALQRVPLDNPSDEEEEENSHFGLAMPLSLKDFTSKHSNGRKSRIGQRNEDMKGLGIALPDFTASRGRATVRLTPPSRSGRGRGQTRSLSARRPQSWRMPSPDIYSIKEEKESDDEKKKGEEDELEGGKETPIAMSAPSTSKIDEMMMQMPKKPKKRVHWAI